MKKNLLNHLRNKIKQKVPQTNNSLNKTHYFPLITNLQQFNLFINIQLVFSQSYFNQIVNLFF